jgi:hypothetical protein
LYPRSDLQELNQLEDKAQYIIGYFESRDSAQYENFRKTAMNLKAGLRIRIHFIRIRIQHFRLYTDPDPDQIRIRIQGFNDLKLYKNNS